MVEPGRGFDRYPSGGGGGSRTRVRKHFNETFSGRRRLFRRSYSSRSLSRRQAVTRVRSGELHDVWHGQSLPYSHLPLNDALPGPRSLRVGRLLLIKQQKQQYRCCLIYNLPILWRLGAAARWSRLHTPVETVTPPSSSGRNPLRSVSAAGLRPLARTALRSFAPPLTQKSADF